MSSFRHYVKNVGMLVGQSFVQRALGMVTTVVLARVLGAAGFGAYSVVTATSSSAYGLVRLGVDAAIHVHTAEGYEGEAARRRMEEMLAAGFLLLLLAGGLGGLACLLMADRLALAVYDKPELAVWIRVAGIAVFLQCLSQFAYATLVGLHRFAEYARVMAASAVLNTAAISLASLVAGLHGAVTALVAVQAVTLAWLGLSMAAGLHKASLGLAFRNPLARARQLLGFGFPFYVAGLISVPAIYYLQGMVARYAGLDELGYLRVITALVSIVSFAPQSAAAAMVSMFTRTRAEDRSALPIRIIQNVKLILLFSLVTAATVVVSLPWLIPLLFGPQYIDAIRLASIAVLTAILSTVATVISNALFSSRRVDLVFVTTSLGAAAFFICGVALIPAHGLTGYLIAELSGYIVFLLAVFWGSSLWRRVNSVDLAWLAKALVPMILLATYSAVQVFSGASASAGRGVASAVGVLLVCVWVYAVVLNSAERRALQRWISQKS